jgi:hypothetical protein
MRNLGPLRRWPGFLPLFDFILRNLSRNNSRERSFDLSLEFKRGDFVKLSRFVCLRFPASGSRLFLFHRGLLIIASVQPTPAASLHTLSFEQIAITADDRSHYTDVIFGFRR